MKLIFLNRYCFPDISATSQILTELAEHLASAGWEVHVIASRQRYDDARASLAPEEAVGGFRVHRVWTTRFGRAGSFGRAMDYLTFHAAAGVCLLRLARRGDIVVAKTDPPLISVVAAWVARRRGAVLINWLQDIFPEIAERLGVRLMAGAVGRAAKRLRDYSVRTAAHSVVLGERMAQTMAELVDGGPGRTRSIKVIHNWSDGNLLRPVAPDKNALRTAWGLNGLFVVGYSGNMGRAHEFETIMGAAERLRDVDDIAIVFIGGGNRAGWIRAEAQRRGLAAKFRFHDYQPRERLGESLSVPDVHLVTLRPELEGLVVPSKFYGIAAVGRPTVFVGDLNGEIPRILREADCGLAVGTGDADGLASAIETLRRDPALRSTLGSNARRVFERRFDRPRAMAQWSVLLAEAAGIEAPVADGEVPLGGA